MKRSVKWLVVFGSLALSLFVTVYRDGRNGHHGFEVATQRSSVAASDAAKKSSYDLAALRVFNVTLVRVKDNYVAPDRIQPKAMLLAALDSVQKNVAEVLVEPSRDNQSVRVKVEDAERSYPLGDVDSPWALSAKLKDIFRFVQRYLHPETDLRDLEYAAVNGMLSTLDPHSVLLPPTVYDEMKLQTRGHFGGLGIVIGLRRGRLTVLKPMPETPAWKAGIKKGDHISKINEESTVNMTLTEAVSRLRGEPGTNVAVWLDRSNQPSRRVQLTRDVIKVASVESRLLKQNVGYLKLSNFQGSTFDELKTQLKQLREKGARAFVLDLRGNPGGLLDQAVKVADLFVDQGTLVTTVGLAGKQREEKRAQPGGGSETKSPLAVIVSGNSASASEIVAGALKNLDRAVVIGQPTFGKGSVQVLYENDDDSALKLTIAQYLTPGDISIQSVGITPDIQTTPILVPHQLATPCDGVIFTPSSHAVHEKDLDAHLEHRNVRKGEKPSQELEYLRQPPAERKCALTQEDTGGDSDGEPVEEASADDEEPADDNIDEKTGQPKFDENKDFEIQLARDLLAQAHSSRRRELLGQSTSFIDKRRQEEGKRIGEALTKLGVDWSVGKPAAPAKLSAHIVFDHKGAAIEAGDVVQLKATVRNEGSTNAYRLRARISTDDEIFDERELVFGHIAPGQSKTVSVPVKIPRAALTRVDTLNVTWSEQYGAMPTTPEVKLTLQGEQRPLFAYSYQLIDDVGGDADGVIERGEKVRVRVSVKNLGLGKAYDTWTTLKNGPGQEGIFIDKGRFGIGAILPGMTKSADFILDVKPEYQGDQFTTELSVYDAVLREYVAEKLKFPVSAQRVNSAPAAAQGSVTINIDHALFRTAPTITSSIVGEAPKGASFKLLGKIGGKGSAFLRVQAEDGRPAFVAESDATIAASPEVKGAAGFIPRWQVSPPVLMLANTSLEVTTPTYTVSGSAKADRRVQDLFIFVNNSAAKISGRKVFYTSNRNAKDSTMLPFNAQIPLWPGVNHVTVVARENDEVQSRQTMIVFRRDSSTTAAAAPAATPKTAN